MEKPYVLLVDDNEATCTLIIALLRRDFHVDVATDGIEALERLKTANYAAILLDLRMPHMDGFAVLEHLHTNRPEILSRVIVLTAALSGRELERIKDFPVCNLVAKPFDVDALLSAVRTCAGVGGTGFSNVLSSGVILLLADLIQRRLL